MYAVVLLLHFSIKSLVKQGMAHSASTDYHSSSYKIFVFVDLPLFTMADTQRDVKSLGDRLIKKFSVREKSNGIPIVKRKVSGKSYKFLKIIFQILLIQSQT